MLQVAFKNKTYCVPYNDDETLVKRNVRIVAGISEESFDLINSNNSQILKPKHSYDFMP